MNSPAEASHVPWRDLVRLHPHEKVLELLLPFPWLGLSFVLAARGLTVPALAASFFFFLAGLRVVHDCMHRNLGVSARAHDVCMFVLGLLMQSSMHAEQVNHLEHHRHALSERDHEAKSARMSALGAIAYGPLFYVLAHVHGLRAASRRRRRWILAELAAISAWVAFALGPAAPEWLRYHAVAMFAGQGLAAFFCVWTVHRGGRGEEPLTRTLRGRVWNTISFHMFLHLEHHLFPAVPTRHLPRLARRMDRRAPGLVAARVF